MKTTLNNIVIFAAGAAIGSAVTWKILKERYEQIAQEEINSVKEAYFGKTQDEEEAVESEEVVEEKNALTDIREYAAQIQKQGYVDYANTGKTNQEVDNVITPYVISPEEFGENDDYETISLIYFADKVLTDDDYELVQNVDDVVGRESLNHFGEYEDDSVFVRNDEMKADYEILLDPRKYRDVIKTKPHSAEVE